MVEFSCEAVWTWAFVCWKISDYSFNFCACDESVKIFYFFPGRVLESCTFLRICPFLPRCPFYWHIIADSSLLWSFIKWLFKKYKFIYFNWRLITLQYCIDFAIHQHESAMGVHTGRFFTDWATREAPFIIFK